MKITAQGRKQLHSEPGRLKTRERQLVVFTGSSLSNQLTFWKTEQTITAAGGKWRAACGEPCCWPFCRVSRALINFPLSFGYFLTRKSIKKNNYFLFDFTERTFWQPLPRAVRRCDRFGPSKMNAPHADAEALA
ncbi:MAG: hypothetical protein ACFHWX_18405 [Bacteroidota bacterium]